MLAHTCTVACDFVAKTIGICINATTLKLYKDMESIALPLLVSPLLKNQHLFRILTLYDFSVSTL